MVKGYVYILTNPCIQYAFTDAKGAKAVISPVKIGMAKNVESRLGTLNTSLPENFVHHMSVGADDAKALENVVHRLLGSYRIMTRSGEKTEFFRCSVEEAMRVLKQTAKDMHLKEYKIDKSKMEGRSAHGIRAKAKAKAKPVGKSVEAWEGKTQLAKIIARRGGNEGAYGGILQFFSEPGAKARKSCSPSSKWRKALESAGLQFDSHNFVIDWRTAKNPL